MKKPVFELSVNKRVPGRHGTVSPQNRIAQRAKNFSLRVECAADYPRRVVKLENLNDELLQKKLYSDMKPVSIFSGEYLVTPGYEEQFKSIVQEHGFRAMELIET